MGRAPGTSLPELFGFGFLKFCAGSAPEDDQLLLVPDVCGWGPFFDQRL